MPIGMSGNGNANNHPQTMGTHLSKEWIAHARDQKFSRLPIIQHMPPARVIEGLDLWDMWQLTRPDGSPVIADEREYWFFLATAMLDDPEDRHDIARIRFTSLGTDGWRDHGWLLPDGWSPGSREWSGYSVLAEDGRTVTLYFTATGQRDGPHSFEQRLFETHAEFEFDGDMPVFRNWSKPVQSVAADGHWYKIADQIVAPAHGIWGFRDPCFFRDPADGAEYLLFTGSAGWTDNRLDGVIGLATRTMDGWTLQPPLIEAVGVNSEMERPHVIVRDGLYYCFWSSHGRRHAADLGAPTGLYGMVAERFAGPWRPLNGTGLVAANPVDSPLQAYCWWVSSEGNVISFIDYPGAKGTEPPQARKERRAMFGGTVAPVFSLIFDGDVVQPQPACEWE